MSKTECYYAVLGLCKQASAMEIRSAYRKLALKWHPDRCTRNDPLLVGDAKNRFQQIQEAYSVLSDDGKRLLYDAELIDISVQEDANEEVDQEGFSDFMQEMMAMMETSRPKKRHSLKELQVMLGEMMAEDDSVQFNCVNSSNPPQVSCKRTRFGTS